MSIRFCIIDQHSSKANFLINKSMTVYRINLMVYMVTYKSLNCINNFIDHVSQTYKCSLGFSYDQPIFAQTQTDVLPLNQSI